MSSTDPITGVFNDGYINEAYEAYRRDPTSVDESWRQFFRFAESLGGAPQPPRTPGEPSQWTAGEAPFAGQLDPAFLREIAAGAELGHAIRSYGHMGVSLEPLRTPPARTPEPTPK